MFSQLSFLSRVRRDRARRALGFASPYRKSVALLFGIIVIMALANACEPLVIKFIFDRLQSERLWKPILEGIAVLAGLGLIREAAGAVTQLAAALGGPRQFNRRCLLI